MSTNNDDDIVEMLFDGEGGGSDSSSGEEEPAPGGGSVAALPPAAATARQAARARIEAAYKWDQKDLTEWIDSPAGQRAFKKYKKVTVLDSLPGSRQSNCKPGMLYHAFVFVKGVLKEGGNDIRGLCRLTALEGQGTRVNGAGDTTNLWKHVREKHEDLAKIMEGFKKGGAKSKGKATTAAAPAAAAGQTVLTKAQQAFKGFFTTKVSARTDVPGMYLFLFVLLVIIIIYIIWFYICVCVVPEISLY
jgi:hypothetical protein